MKTHLKFFSDIFYITNDKRHFKELFFAVVLHKSLIYWYVLENLKILQSKKNYEKVWGRF